MPLSNDLISQFVKATNDDHKQETETTIYATAGKTEGGVTYVTFDGAEQPTPVVTTTDMQENERVKVTIKDHQAIATGNVSSPGINLNTQINTGVDNGTVPVSDIITATTAYVDALYAQKAYIEELVAEKATIDELIANNITVTDLIAQKATMDEMIANKITVIDLIGDKATIDNLIADNATIGDLIAKKADIEHLHANYANIDFANITEAAIGKLYSNIGVIEGFTTKDATVTDKLVAVNIHGDVINAGTLKADKLIIKGEDGLYYRLNAASLGDEVVATKEEYKEGLDGSVIIADSVTANKISTTDLVAFNATLGRFNIDVPSNEEGEYEDTGSIYSGAKASVDNTTTGVYMDSEGQFAVGDADNYLKFYKDENGNNKFIVSVDELRLGTSKDTIEDYVGQQKQAVINQLRDEISMLVTDENGQSVMVQNGDGWTFNLSNVKGVVESEWGAVLQSAKDNSDYVNIGTYGDQPCIELGESSNDSKVIITNTESLFKIGSDIPTKVSNTGVETDNIKVDNDLIQRNESSSGYYVWKVRNNGNYGLQWKGGNS